MAHDKRPDSPRRAAVITVSNRSSRGERPDTSGPRAVEALRAAGYEVDPALIIPDGVASVREALQAAIASGVHVVITSGEPASPLPT